jgi:hypothetical protein
MLTAGCVRPTVRVLLERQSACDVVQVEGRYAGGRRAVDSNRGGALHAFVSSPKVPLRWPTVRGALIIEVRCAATASVLPCGRHWLLMASALESCLQQPYGRVRRHSVPVLTMSSVVCAYEGVYGSLL